MKHDAFISYSSAEFDQADWVRQNLEANGISCWMAPDSIPGGSGYGDAIATAIDQCPFFVLILSPKAQASQWVPKELDLALNSHATVLPFMIEKCELVGDFRLYLPNVQHYYAYAGKEQAMAKLIGDIRSQLRKPVGKPNLIKAKTKVDHRLWGILGTVAALMIAGVLLYPHILQLLGINPANPLPEDTQGQQPPSETTASTQAPTTTAPASSEHVAPTTGQVVIVSPGVLPTLDTQLDSAQLSSGLTNHSRKAAEPLTPDAIHTGTLENETDYWYEFITAGDVEVYRIGALRSTDPNDPAVFNLNICLYNEQGMKLEEFSVYRADPADYLDLILEPGTKYYLKVNTPDTVAAKDIAGFGLFVSPRPSDTGLNPEEATELTLGYQHTFVLNSTLGDCLVFRPQKGASYRVTLYNIDVGGTIEVHGINDSGGSMCSLQADNEDSDSTTFYGHTGRPVYLDVHTHDGFDDPNGTYVIVIEEN